MLIEPLKLEGTFQITMQPIRDQRGYFTRAYDKHIFAENGLNIDWVQENQSQTVRKDTIRGLHFQMPPFTETKLVRAVQGAVLDVFVDLRKNSPTFGHWDSIELTEDNFRYIYIPCGFAHGFRTLSKIATVQYKVDSVFSPEHDSGIRWDDPDLRINWDTAGPMVSDKDSKLPFLKDLDSPFG